MTAQRLDRVLTAFRIGDPHGSYPIFDPTGSRLAPGRWNTSASPMIYASEHYSTAMLEKLVRANGDLPPNQHFIEITIPNGISYELLNPAHLPRWDDVARATSQAYGEAYAAWDRGEREGIWAKHEAALTAMYDALDQLQLHSTQWNYTASNRNDLDCPRARISLCSKSR